MCVREEEGDKRKETVVDERKGDRQVQICRRGGEGERGAEETKGEAGTREVNQRKGEGDGKEQRQMLKRCKREMGERERDPERGERGGKWYYRDSELIVRL